MNFLTGFIVGTVFAGTMLINSYQDYTTQTQLQTCLDSKTVTIANVTFRCENG